MADEIKNNTNDAVEELLNIDRKEKETMTTGEKIGKWLERNGETLFMGAMALGIIGATVGLSVASIKSDERVKKAKLDDKAAERALQEKWMETQLECARIEADAFVRKETATTNDIANIVKAMKE